MPNSVAAGPPCPTPPPPAVYLHHLPDLLAPLGDGATALLDSQLLYCALAAVVLATPGALVVGAHSALIARASAGSSPLHGSHGWGSFDDNGFPKPSLSFLTLCYRWACGAGSAGKRGRSIGWLPQALHAAPLSSEQPTPPPMQLCAPGLGGHTGLLQRGTADPGRPGAAGDSMAWGASCSAAACTLTVPVNGLGQWPTAVRSSLRLQVGAGMAALPADGIPAVAAHPAVVPFVQGSVLLLGTACSLALMLGLSSSRRRTANLTWAHSLVLLAAAASLWGVVLP